MIVLKGEQRPIIKSNWICELTFVLCLPLLQFQHDCPHPYIPLPPLVNYFPVVNSCTCTQKLTHNSVTNTLLCPYTATGMQTQTHTGEKYKKENHTVVDGSMLKANYDCCYVEMHTSKKYINITVCVKRGTLVSLSTSCINMAMYSVCLRIIMKMATLVPTNHVNVLTFLPCPHCFDMDEGLNHWARFQSWLPHLTSVQRYSR